jgi:hypothetical protein
MRVDCQFATQQKRRNNIVWFCRKPLLHLTLPGFSGSPLNTETDVFMRYPDG